VLDLRTYKLVPGKRKTFDDILRKRALPMLRRYGIVVVGYGPSLADDDHYYLARAFPSAAEREQQLGAFYGSEEWQRNFEDGVMELIDAYHTVCDPIDAAHRACSR
jgi:peptidoglycan/xylan/chitin deacetylase (PgdA/CDA1 family)